MAPHGKEKGFEN